MRVHPQAIVIRLPGAAPRRRWSARFTEAVGRRRRRRMERVQWRERFAHEHRQSSGAGENVRRLEYRVRPW